MIRIGIDFDNTLVCYDRLFHQFALERNLIPTDLPATKTIVRDWLRHASSEPEWTELQGFVYGEGIQQAKPFPHAIKCLHRWVQERFELHIVSHKTRFSVSSARYDLHASARAWLTNWKIDDPSVVGIPITNWHFEETKEEKWAKISQLGCTCFIDDLPEFLTHEQFPKNVQPVLFSPDENHQESLSFPVATEWEQLDYIIHQIEHSSLAAR